MTIAPSQEKPESPYKEDMPQAVAKPNKEDGTESKALFGVLEYISLQGGTFKAFNPGIITGTVLGMTYRYFITEGWIGLKTPDCPPGKSIECLTVDDFQDTLNHHAQNVRECAMCKRNISPIPGVYLSILRDFHGVGIDMICSTCWPTANELLYRIPGAPVRNAHGQTIVGAAHSPRVRDINHLKELAQEGEKSRKFKPQDENAGTNPNQ